MTETERRPEDDDRGDLASALRILRRVLAARDHRQRIQARYYSQAERLLKKRERLLIETAKT